MDETCGGVGNVLLVAEGPPDDIRVLFVGLYYRGQRRLDLEREYLDIYHPINEAIPRQLQRPAGSWCRSPGRWTWCGWCCRSPSSGNHRRGRRPRGAGQWPASCFFFSPTPKYFLKTAKSWQ